MLRFLQLAKKKPVHACYSWSLSTGYYRTACGLFIEKENVETFSFEELVRFTFPPGICLVCKGSIKSRIAHA